MEDSQEQQAATLDAKLTQIEQEEVAQAEQDWQGIDRQVQAGEEAAPQAKTEQKPAEQQAGSETEQKPAEQQAGSETEQKPAETPQPSPQADGADLYKNQIATLEQQLKTAKQKASTLEALSVDPEEYAKQRFVDNRGELPTDVELKQTDELAVKEGENWSDYNKRVKEHFKAAEESGQGEKKQAEGKEANNSELNAQIEVVGDLIAKVGNHQIASGLVNLIEGQGLSSDAIASAFTANDQLDTRAFQAMLNDPKCVEQLKTIPIEGQGSIGTRIAKATQVLGSLMGQATLKPKPPGSIKAGELPTDHNAAPSTGGDGEPSVADYTKQIKDGNFFG